jgi:hypothetical protein
MQQESKLSKDYRDFFEVRYFDETDGLDPEVQALLNTKI